MPEKASKQVTIKPGLTNLINKYDGSGLDQHSLFGGFVSQSPASSAVGGVSSRGLCFARAGYCGAAESWAFGRYWYSIAAVFGWLKA